MNTEIVFAIFWVGYVGLIAAFITLERLVETNNLD